MARIAEAMPPDDAADLIGELEVGETEEVLHHISFPDEEVLRQLLIYPEDTAGGIMHPEAVALQPAETVDDAIQVLHAIDEDTPIAALYVVDEYRRLLGYVRLRNMVTARPASSLGDIMSTDVISVTVATAMLLFVS